MSTSEPTVSSQTVVETKSKAESTPPVLKLKLKKAPRTQKVKWTEDTVDNEHLDKKKSKCCCIYQKPLEFGESESDSDSDDCQHCSHHKKKDYVAPRDANDNAGAAAAAAGPGDGDETKSHASHDTSPDANLNELATIVGGEKIVEKNGNKKASSNPSSNAGKRHRRSQLRNEAIVSPNSGPCRHFTKINTRLNSLSIANSVKMETEKALFVNRREI